MLKSVYVIASFLGVSEALKDETPVNKVLTLLREMQSTLEDESVKDKSANEKMQCWCKKTKEELSSTIEKETIKGETATADMEKYFGKQQKNRVDAENNEKEAAEA